MGFEIISKEATEARITLGSAKDHPVRTAALQLRPGESFVLENKDWNWKSNTPSAQQPLRLSLV